MRALLQSHYTNGYSDVKNSMREKASAALMYKERIVPAIP